MFRALGERCPSHSFQPPRQHSLVATGRKRDALQQAPQQAHRACRAVCMATPRRQARVAKAIEREVGALFVTDQAVQAAVSPSGSNSLDATLASVTEVEVSGDLQIAKVYVSITGDDINQELAMEGLSRMRGYVRKHVARTVRLRFVPEIRFFLDDTLEQEELLTAAFDRARRQASGELEPPPIMLRGGYLGLHASQSKPAETMTESSPSSQGDLNPLQQAGSGSAMQEADALTGEGFNEPDAGAETLTSEELAVLGESDAAAAEEAAQGIQDADEDHTQEQAKLMERLDSMGFFGQDGDDDDDEFDGMLESVAAPTTPRGRKKLQSVGRRRHMPRGSRGR